METVDSCWGIENDSVCTAAWFELVWLDGKADLASLI